jgi:hypothetical protein
MNRQQAVLVAEALSRYELQQNLKKEAYRMEAQKAFERQALLLLIIAVVALCVGLFRFIEFATQPVHLPGIESMQIVTIIDKEEPKVQVAPAAVSTERIEQPVSVPIVTSESMPVSETLTYTVAKKDCLSHIVKNQFHSPLRDMEKVRRVDGHGVLRKLENPHHIEVGWVLQMNPGQATALANVPPTS